MGKKDIHIVLSSSDEFLPYCATTMTSILYNISEAYNVHFHVLSYDITEKNKKKLVKLNKIKQCTIDYPQFDEKMLDMFNGIKIPPHVTKMTYARILIPNILPDVDKAIFIDSDTLVRKDISELYEIDLKDNCFGAVEDVDYINLSQHLWGHRELYFNGGMLLINLKKLRDIDYISIIKEAIRKNGKKYLICDQSVINDAFRGKIMPLSCKYNLYHCWHFNFSRYEPSNVFDFKKSLKDPVIVHFVGPDKPWYDSVSHQYKKEYAYYKKINKSFISHYLLKKIKYNTRNASWTHLKFCGFDLFNIKTCNTLKKLKVLGITIYKEKKNKDVYKRYIFNLLVYKRTIKSKRLLLFKVVADNSFYSFSILGIPIIKKLDNKYKQYIKILGFPFFYNHNLQQFIEDLINNSTHYLSNDISYQLSKLQEFNYQIMWYPQKVAMLHSSVFPKFKQKHRNEDFVIVGCGPTLSDYSPLKNAIHMGLNRAFVYDKIKYDYLFMWDFPGMYRANDGKEIIHRFLSYNAVKFAGQFLNDHISNTEDILNKAGELYRCYSSARHGLSIPVTDDFIHPDISVHPLVDFMSVSFGALHFASYTHPKRIFLVGCDTTPGSFNGRSDHKDFKTMIRGYKLFKDFIAKHYPDTEVISVNPVGLKGLFKDVYTKEYLKNHPEINSDVEILNV